MSELKLVVPTKEYEKQVKDAKSKKDYGNKIKIE